MFIYYFEQVRFTVEYKTSQQVASQTSVVEMTSETKGLKGLKWEVFVEKAGIWGEADFVKFGFVDHINTTKFTTDYLWYTTRFVFPHDEINCMH